MLEIEQKYAQVNVPLVQAVLRQLGVGDAPTVQVEIDHYLNGPDRDFARTGEAFRLRRVGDANYLTYKGPKLPSCVKVRTELEIPLLGGEQVAEEHLQLLQHLGYRPVAQVRKTRTTYQLDYEGFSFSICLDEVATLGTFAEVEVLAPSEQVEAATRALLRLAEALQLRGAETRSYLQLVLDAQAASAARAKEPMVVHTVAQLRQQLSEVRRQRKTVGLVPTMGALHQGHASLIEAARAREEVVVVSIFVNPTQFGPKEDFERYPRPMDEDIGVCGRHGVDLIYHPSVEEMYPEGYRTYVEVTGWQDILEGASRPGHFRGVATVVLKLLNQVQPDRAYFGQKDAQQVRVIQQLVRDLNVPVEILVRPTVREADGLAMSSRNRYLDADQRQRAVALYQALREASEQYQAGVRDPEVLRRVMTQRLQATPGAELDYAVVLDPDTFQPAEDLTRGALLALAVKFGDTRLIDNLILSEEKGTGSPSEHRG